MGEFFPCIHESAAGADDSGGNRLVLTEGTWWVDHPFEVLDEEPSAGSELASPCLSNRCGFCQMCQEKPGIDEVGRCTGQRQFGDVASLESDSDQASPRGSEELFGGINADGSPWSADVRQQLGGERWTAAKIDSHIGLLGCMGGEKRSGDRVVRRRYEPESICGRLIDPEAITTHKHIVTDNTNKGCGGGARGPEKPVYRGLGPAGRECQSRRLAR